MEELRELLPEARASDEEIDSTCGLCGHWIEWDAKPWSGVRVELK